MTKVDNIINFGFGIGALFALAIQKYNYSYVMFSVLLGWNILSNFVSGDSIIDFSPMKTAYLIFSIILFFVTLYLTILTFRKQYVFERGIAGELPFYIRTSNFLILFVFFVISMNDRIKKSLNDMLPNCGDLILLLTIFLFTYLLSVMVINISIIVNKKVTDG